MTDATPQFLDPTLGLAAVPRPAGLTPGCYPLQADARRLAWWTLGSSNRAIRAPFGAAVGEPLHYAYDLAYYRLLAIDCRGAPDQADDRCVVQMALNNPPQVGRVVAGWWWADWRHSTLSQSVSFNTTLVLVSGNAFLGVQERAGIERPVPATTGLGGGGTALASLTGITLVDPGSATVPTLNCPLVSEDGTTPEPRPLRIPCWVGRWGFPGLAGQVMTGGSSTQNLGFFLKIKPVTTTFSADAVNLRLTMATATAEAGCEIAAACTYTLALIEPEAGYQESDTTQPGPPYPCRVYAARCWKSQELTAFIQVFLTPLGAAWTAVVAIHQMAQVRSAGGGRYVLFSNFSPVYYTAKASLSQGKLPDEVSATPIPLGGTTTIVRSLLGGKAGLEVTITVSATGVVTAGAIRITRGVPVTNLGPGWHDQFAAA